MRVDEGKDVTCRKEKDQPTFASLRNLTPGNCVCERELNTQG